MNTERYEARGWSKFSEEDIYNEGCQIHSGNSGNGNDLFFGDTILEVIDKCQEFVGSESMEDCLLNSCGEEGRLDIQIMEDENSTPAGKHDLEEWKAGRKRLWLSCYSFYIENVAREAVFLKIEA